MPTIINDTEQVEVDATVDDRWLMSPPAFEALTGWTLQPEGMCRDDVCAPLYRRTEVVTDDGLIDLEAAAPIIGLSAVVDTSRRVAALTAAASTRSETMTSLLAPDFTLPDLDGRPVHFHDFERRKVLLLAWSSW